MFSLFFAEGKGSPVVPYRQCDTGAIRNENVIAQELCAFYFTHFDIPYFSFSPLTLQSPSQLFSNPRVDDRIGIREAGHVAKTYHACRHRFVRSVLARLIHAGALTLGLKGLMHTSIWAGAAHQPRSTVAQEGRALKRPFASRRRVIFCPGDLRPLLFQRSVPRRFFHAA